jgi:hypothetical protein
MAQPGGASGAAWQGPEDQNQTAARPLISGRVVFKRAEPALRAGPSLTKDSFIAALEATRDYKVNGLATSRTFSTKHHIGNLTLVPMEVRSGTWEPVPWSSTHQSDILKRYE